MHPLIGAGQARGHRRIDGAAQRVDRQVAAGLQRDGVGKAAQAGLAAGVEGITAAGQGAGAAGLSPGDHQSQGGIAEGHARLGRAQHTIDAGAADAQHRGHGLGLAGEAQPQGRQGKAARRRQIDQAETAPA